MKTHILFAQLLVTIRMSFSGPLPLNPASSNPLPSPPILVESRINTTNSIKQVLDGLRKTPSEKLMEISVETQEATFTKLEYLNNAGTSVLHEGGKAWPDRDYIWQGVGAQLDGQVAMVNGPCKSTPIGTVFTVEPSCDTVLFVFFERHPRTGGFDQTLLSAGFSKVEQSEKQIAFWAIEGGTQYPMDTWSKAIQGGASESLPATTKSFVGTIGIQNTCAGETGVQWKWDQKGSRSCDDVCKEKSLVCETNKDIWPLTKEAMEDAVRQSDAGFECAETSQRNDLLTLIVGPPKNICAYSTSMPSYDNRCARSWPDWFRLCPCRDEADEDEDAVAELKAQLNEIKSSIEDEQNSASAGAGAACTSDVSVSVDAVGGDTCGLLGCAADSTCQVETTSLQSEATAATNEIGDLEAQLAIDKQKRNALEKEKKNAEDVHGTNADTVAEEADETARHDARILGLNHNIDILKKINNAFARENGAISMPSLLTTEERKDVSNLRLGGALLLMLDQKLTANPELVRKIKALLERLINLLEAAIDNETTAHTATMEAIQAKTIDLSGEIAILEGEISNLNQKIADANKLLGEKRTLEALKTKDCGTRQQTCITNHQTYKADMTGFSDELAAVEQMLEMLPQLALDELNGQAFE